MIESPELKYRTRFVGMPVLRRRFQKFDENVAESILQETTKTPATTIGNKKSSRDPSFGLLLETPSATQRPNSFAEWNTFEEHILPFESDDEKQNATLEPPYLSHSQESVTKSISQESQKENKLMKIPLLKANRLDDIRHNRAKEILSEVKKDTKGGAKVSPVNQDIMPSFEPSEPVSFEENKMNSNLPVTIDLPGWTPFEAGFPASLPENLMNEEHDCSGWDCFGQMPIITSEGSASQIVVDVLPSITPGDNSSSKNCEAIDQEKDCTSSEISMPSTVNIENVLENAEVPWEQASQSDIISVQENSGDGSVKIFLNLKCNTNVSEEILVPDSPPHLPEDDSEATFSLGLEMINETNSRRTSTQTTHRLSLCYDRQELLSPVVALPTTPEGALAEDTVANVAEKTMRYERNMPNTEDQTKRYERKLPMEKIVEADDTVKKNISPVSRLKQNSGSPKSVNVASKLADKTPDRKRRCHSPLVLDVQHEEAFFRSARQRIQMKRSIHFPTKTSPKTQSSSLLDADIDDSDTVSEDQSRSASIESASEYGGKSNIIIDTSSFHSGDVSAMTYPHVLKLSDDSCVESGKHKSAWTANSERTEKSSSRHVGVQHSKRPQKTKAKPLGSSTQEIKMLNTFLSVVGRKLHASTLSIDEREEIHNRAIKAGLPEDFVNKILDQTAGIVRWEEQSVGTITTCESTEMSSRSKHSVSSVDSQSTRYMKDDESISYDSFREMKSTSKDMDEGGYGCFQNFKSSFWLQGGIAGDDMVENVTAAFSESFDELSRCRQQRRKRKTQLRL